MTDDTDKRPVLVLGATGMQGGAVLRALLDRGVAVRALVRDVSKAHSLVVTGATVAVGTFDDTESLATACSGVRAVFSMQNPPAVEEGSERRQGQNIVDAARAAGVEHFLHTSVSGAGAFHRKMAGYGEGRWWDNYWDSKAYVEDAVRAADFPCYTILKPAFMMENLTRPKADFMFPELMDDRLVTALRPDTEMAWVAADDIGTSATTAIFDPQRFKNADIELAGDRKTMEETASILSNATGRSITAISVSSQEAMARGQHAGWVNSQEWDNEVGYPATPADAAEFGLSPLDLTQWAKKNAAVIAKR